MLTTNESRCLRAGRLLDVQLGSLCWTCGIRIPGNVSNASSYNFPVRHKVLKGATIEMIVRGILPLLNMILEAGRELQQEGVRALVGACGYFSRYHAGGRSCPRYPGVPGSLLQCR